MIWPEAIVLTALAPNSGSVKRPERVALAPLTSCRNTGRNTIAANNDAALARRDQIRDAGVRECHHAAGADSLQRPEGDQPADALRGPSLESSCRIDADAAVNLW